MDLNIVDASEIRQYNQLIWYIYVNIPLFTGFQKHPNKGGMFILLIVKKGDMFIHVEFQYYKASKPYLKW